MGDLDSSTLRQALFDATLAPLPRDHDNPDLAEFYRLLRDYPERGGKGLRGLILLYATEAYGQPWRASLELAAGLELFQNWVLVHDDIEDDSEDRRGKPALHRSVGLPVALNVGDAMHVYMWQLLHTLPGVSPDVHRQLLAEFAQMIHRTAEGQHLDLCWVAQGRFDVSEAEYLEMVTLKTAYYTVIAPLRLGALRCGASPDPRITQAGVDLGAAFQIRDDVLNLSRDVAYGKEFAGDLYEAKRTLILAHFFAHATQNGTERGVRAAREGARREDERRYRGDFRVHRAPRVARLRPTRRRNEGPAGTGAAPRSVRRGAGSRRRRRTPDPARFSRSSAHKHTPKRRILNIKKTLRIAHRAVSLLAAHVFPAHPAQSTSRLPVTSSPACGQPRHASPASAPSAVSVQRT
ncbi:MAG: polyprenyl synthetase family protein [Trueperaceae bacterium]|nr:polyprenyl synthetase family protein [Trueperaceae bacterium]